MQLLKQRIKEKGLLQTYVAKTLGINPSLLSMYLNEHRPCPVEVKKLLTILLS